MINKKSISNLAKATIKNGVLDKKAAQVSLSSLSRKELILYLRYLERIISEEFVKVEHSESIPLKLKQEIEKKYRGKIVYYMENIDIRDGIIVSFNDTVIDLSFKGRVDKLLNNLTSE